MRKNFIILFLILSSLLYVLLDNLKDNIKDKALKSITYKYNKAYETIYSEKKNMTKIMLSGLIAVGSLEDRLYKLRTATKEQKEKIRKVIFDDLKERYKKLQELGIGQLHIHLPNNESFLRMHRPEFYGDNLKGIRPSIKYVNKFKKPIDTPENGKLYYGFRFVYPLFKDEIYIGSIEISFSAKEITSSIMKHYDVLSNFFIKSFILDKKILENMNKFYKPSHHEGYYYDLNVLKELKNVSNKNLIQLKPNKKFLIKLKEMAQKNEPSSIFYENINSVITVIPIFNKITNENIAFLTIRGFPDYIVTFLKYYKLFIFVNILLLGFVLSTIYVLISQKRTLKDEVNKKTHELAQLNNSLNLHVLEQTNKLMVQNEELKKSKRNIDKERKKFEYLLNNATDGIHILDEEGNVIICSNSFATMLGYPKEEALELNVKDWDVGIDKENLMVTLKEIIDSQKQFETRHKRKDGSVFYSRINARGVELNGEKYLYASSRNIDESIKLQKEIEEKNSLLTQVKEIAELGHWKYDLNNNDLDWSDEVYNIFELDKEKVKPSYELFVSLVHPDDLNEVINSYEKALRRKKSYELEHRILLPNGKIKHVVEKCHTKFDKRGKPLYSLGTIIDNTKQYEIRANLEKFIDTQNNLIILTSEDELKFANKRFFEYFGFENLEEFKKHYNHKSILELFIRNDRFFHINKLKNPKDWLNNLKSLPQSKRMVSLLDKTFKAHAFSLSLNEFSNDTTIISFTDISETMLEQIDLENKVIHDKLTNAYNREYFEQNYKKLILNYNTYNSKLALALLDIDHFKDVNDNYGHDVGDEVLKEFVKTIQKYSRNDDILVRWGGEEFILALKVNSLDDLKNALEHLRQVIEIHKFPKLDKLTVSIGASIYKDNEEIESTIKRADEAVYKAKQTGRNKVCISNHLDFK